MFEYQITIEYPKEGENPDELVLKPLYFLNPFSIGERVYVNEFNLGRITDLEHINRNGEPLPSQIIIESKTTSSDDTEIFKQRYMGHDQEVRSLVERLN